MLIRLWMGPHAGASGAAGFSFVPDADSSGLPWRAIKGRNTGIQPDIIGLANNFRRGRVEKEIFLK